MKSKILYPTILFCLIVSLLFVFTGSTAVASPNGGNGDPPAKVSAENKDGKKITRGKKKKKDGRRRRSRKQKKEDDDKDELPRGEHEKKFRQGLGEEYVTYYTPHFVVFSNADEELIKSFIHRMEVTYRSVYGLCKRTNVEITPPKEKLVVIYGKTYHDYNEACKTFTGRGVPEWAAGLYYHHPYNFATFFDISTSPNMLQFIEQLDRAQKQIKHARSMKVKKAISQQVRKYRNLIKNYKEKTNREVVQHELSHQCLFNFGFHTLEARNPVWLAEGMATHFEVPPGKSGAGLAALNMSRLGLLREMIKHDAADLKSFVTKAQFAPSLELTGYSLSWGLVEYLLKRHKKEFPGFVKAVCERSMEESESPLNDIELFERHFGPIDKKFQERFENFIMGLPFRNEH